jgi:predicted Zn-dependent protease
MDDRVELLPVLEGCRTRGARAAEILRQRFDSFETSGARVRGARGAEERWTLRVWLDGGRPGLAQAASPRGLVEAALAAAAKAPPDPLAGPADRLPPLTGPLGVDDRRHAAIEEADRNELLSLAERALNSGGVQLRRLRYAERRERRSWMSSREVEQSAAATTYSLEATAALAGVELTQRIASRHFSDVASLPFGTELRRRLEGLARPVALPAAALPVVLDPRAMAALVRAMAPAFVAASVAGGNLLSPRLARLLSSPVLHITDDAGLASGLHTRAFDDRGVPPIPVTLLKEGVPAGLYHDPESARAHGLRPTGHFTDGKVRPTNLIVRPGSRTRNVILTELRDYLVADELPAVNLTTGRVEGRVRLGVVRAGQREGAAVARLELHLAELLARVSEVAADQERSEEVDAPTTVFEPLPWIAD